MASHLAYGIEDRPPLKEAVPLGVQHMLAMLLSNVTIPLIIAGSLGLATGDTALIVQMALFMAGAATLVQAHPIGPVGGRIPVIMGTETNWRKSFLIEFFSDPESYLRSANDQNTTISASSARARGTSEFLRATGLGYKAVRTERYKYIKYN